jgi:hypothetical protein
MHGRCAEANNGHSQSEHYRVCDAPHFGKPIISSALDSCRD